MKKATWLMSFLFIILLFSVYSGDLTADLSQAVNAENTLDYLLQEPVCTEITTDQILNNSLTALWEVRFYPDLSGIRISNTVEEKYYLNELYFWAGYNLACGNQGNRQRELGRKQRLFYS